MPYRLSERDIDGKHKYCMTNKDTGKTYCYDSPAERSKGMQMHEAFAGGWHPTGKAKKKR
jgi:hypothetical protein